MTELSFLIDLLLNHKLPPAVKKLISERIKEVEGALSFPNVPRPQRMPAPLGPPQAASTLALMAKHGDIPQDSVPDFMPGTATVSVENIAQTPAAMQAMQARNEAISAATSGRNVLKERGKMERTSPRKW